MIEKRGEFLEDGIPHVYADRIMAFPEIAPWVEFICHMHKN